MSNVPDAEKTADVDDYRYWITRINQGVKVTRQLLSGSKLDPTAKKEEVPEHEVPADILWFYQQLKAGNMPELA